MRARRDQRRTARRRVAGAEALLAEVENPGQAAHVIGQRLRRGERIPGFGHTVYRSGDGRGDALLRPDPRRRARASRDSRLPKRVLAEAARRKLPPTNIDFALATLVNATGMQAGSGEAIFAIARTVGWLAHAIEEYAKPMRLRLRASYVGTPPTDGSQPA